MKFKVDRQKKKKQKKVNQNLYIIPKELKDPEHKAHDAAMKLIAMKKAIWSDEYEKVKQTERMTNALVLERSRQYFKGMSKKGKT